MFICISFEAHTRWRDKQSGVYEVMPYIIEGIREYRLHGGL